MKLSCKIGKKKIENKLPLSQINHGNAHTFDPVNSAIPFPNSSTCLCKVTHEETDIRNGKISLNADWRTSWVKCGTLPF